MNTNPRIVPGSWLAVAAALLVVWDGSGSPMVVSARQPERVAADPSVQQALDQALADERHAIAFYAAVMARHGERRPFANIIHAERRHEAALLSQYERLGLTPPADAWAGHAFEIPESFVEACDASIVAEIRNARMYDELIAGVGDEQVRAVFDNLRRASLERHLRAFRRHGSGWEAIAADSLTAAQESQRERALAARDAMFASLLGELSKALASGDAPDAIEICATRAPAIAADAAAQHGVRIGRTSWELRSPRNTPPVWAELLVDERVEDPRLMTDRSGRLGVLTPIRLVETCVQCHGSPDQLAPGVGDRLARLYPDDQATGFAVGDLRGWFWVEVPPATGAD